MRLLKFKLLTATILAGALLLQGCGWHLRGSQALPPELQSLHLQTASDNSKFARSLKRSLKAMDVSLADAATGAPYTLSVSDISKSRRTISTTGSAKVAEYALTSTLTYSVNNQEGEQLVPPTQLSTKKTYLYDRNNALGAFEEENLLREEMQRDLVQQLIRRYRAIRPSVTTATAPAEAE